MPEKDLRALLEAIEAAKRRETDALDSAVGRSDAGSPCHAAQAAAQNSVSRQLGGTLSHTQRMAEAAKLASQLGLEPAQMAFVDSLGVQELKTLRESIADAMFDEARPRFERAAAASVLLPNGMLADIAERIAGPMLSARIVGLMDTKAALKITLKCSDSFIADAAMELDPRKAKDLIGSVPVERIARLADILVERKAYVTMGRFVDLIQPDVIARVIAQIKDDEALLRTAFFVESKDVLNDLMQFLPAHRVRDLATLAARGDEDLWIEALALTDHLNAEWKGKVGDMVAYAGEDVLSSLLQNAHRLNLWDSVLAVVAHMNPEARKKIASLPDLADEEVLHSVMLATDANNLWPVFLPLVNDMPMKTRLVAVGMVESLPDEVLQRMLESALVHHLWPSLLGLVAQMHQKQLARLGEVLARQDDDFLTRMFMEVRDKKLWAKVLPLIARMVKGTQRRLSELPILNDMTVVSEIVENAKTEGLLEDIAPMLFVLNDALSKTVGTVLSTLSPDLLKGYFKPKGKKED